MTLPPLPRIGSNCWTRKNGARTLTAKSLSKSATVVSSIVAGFRDSGIGNEDIQAVADHGTNLFGQLVRTVRRGQIGGNGVGAAAGLANFGDDGFGLFHAAAVMDQHLRAGLGEGQRAGAANAARGAGEDRKSTRLN